MLWACIELLLLLQGCSFRDKNETQKHKRNFEFQERKKRRSFILLSCVTLVILPFRLRERKKNRFIFQFEQFNSFII